MQLLAGTSGFSYKEWLGKFYPEKHPADGMLRYYAGHFATVEINNTFYRMPAETMLARWAGEVTEGFSFTLKAPRRITHELRLKDCETHVAEFVRRAEALGAKRAMLCYTDTEEGDSPPIVATAASGYLRLRRTHYEDRDLDDWVERIAALRLERAYVYFMHEDDALGTVFARKLMELWKQRNPK